MRPKGSKATQQAEREGQASGKLPSAERNGIPLLPARKASVPVTLELVNRLRDEQP